MLAVGPVELSVEQSVLLSMRNNRGLDVAQLTPVINGAFETIERGQFEPEVFAESMWQEGYQPSFDEDILQILERAGRFKWVVAIPPRYQQLRWVAAGGIFFLFPDGRFVPRWSRLA